MRWPCELGAAEAAVEPRARSDFESHFATLVHGLNRMRQPLRGASGQIAQRLSDDEETALSVAIVLGAAGLAVALAVFLFTLRTLRPLGVLRRRARQVAEGEYTQRTGVTSHDEIGDLAREFDAMADAIQEREHRLIRSERLATVGRMAAQIAHEVRNPLSSIGLNAELLGDELATEADEARRMVASIIGEVDRLTEITETYLRFTRLPRPKLEREDLGALVASVVAMGRGEIVQEGITLDVDIAPDLPELPADEAQLRQALINLVRNAREALASAPTKRLGISVADDRRRRAVSGRVSPTRARGSSSMTWARSSIRSSRPRRRGRGWGWRWCSRSSSTTAGGSTSRACRGGGPPSRWRSRSERRAGLGRQRRAASRWAAARLRSPRVS